MQTPARAPSCSKVSEGGNPSQATYIAMNHSHQTRVRLAIVGCGTISQLNAPGYLKHEACDVVALCDPVRERAERRAAEWGISPRIYTRYEQVLEDAEIDAVELLTPTHLHAEQSIAALEAGKHVSCQKPVAATLDEATGSPRPPPAPAPSSA